MAVQCHPELPPIGLWGKGARTKMKVNLGGKQVEAEKMEFKAVEENWNLYRLDDGTVVKIKLVLSDVFKLPNIDPVTGAAQLIVRSSNVMSVEPAAQKEEVH